MASQDLDAIVVGIGQSDPLLAAKEPSETHGFMEFPVDAGTERVLGASLHGIEGDEVVHSLLDVMDADASYRVIAESVAIHPTVSELLPSTPPSLESLA